MAIGNLKLEATIVANGSTYSGWESIEISRTFTEPVSYMKFRTSERTSPGSLGATTSLIPGDLASGYLAGRLAITGTVMTRQVVFDGQSHGVEIIVAGQTQELIASSVDLKPGQYTNQTLTQIAQAVAAPVGVNVTMKGDTSGADIPFARVQEHPGERRCDFIERLARWRNMHLVDHENGDLVLARTQSGGSIAATLVEGQNIEAARLIMNQQWAVKDATVITQQPGNDTTNGNDSSQVKESQTNTNYQGSPRPMTILGEQPGNQQEAQLRVNHEIDLNNLDMLECQITTSGWLMDDGTLWIEHVQPPEPVTIYSPMLFPTQGGKLEQNPFM